MRQLSDRYLIECYTQAVELRLEEAFIRLLLSEIQRRNLTIRIYSDTYAI